MSAYLQTWTDGVAGARERAGEPLTHAASDQYGRMGIVPGDVLYIAYLDNKLLHLLGRLPVEQLLTQAQAEQRFGVPVWEASLHAVGASSDLGVFDLRVPDEAVRALRFERATGRTTALNVEADGAVNGGALQSIRRLSPDSAALLDELLEDGALARGRSRRRPVSAEENRAVEVHAMRVVQTHFEADGWVVEDVSRARPYDLVCQRGAEYRHVEVKGLTGPPLRVGLTANEVDHALSCENAALAVVSEIKLEASDVPTAHGGALDIQDPWPLDRDRLRATAYTYALK